MFPENSEDGDEAISPILVISTVLGVLVILSCLTIIGGSLCKAQFRQRRNRRRYEEEDENSQGECCPPQGPALLPAVTGPWICFK